MYLQSLRFSITLKTMILTLFLGLFTTSFPHSTSAKSTNSLSSTNGKANTTLGISQNTLANSATPRVQGGSTGTYGGGSRGANNCIDEGQKPLTPLIPKINQKQELTLVTLASHPTIYMYVPENTAIAGEFILKDSSQKIVYEKLLPVSNSQGIIRIKIPNNQPELKVGENYNWTFSLSCEGSGHGTVVQSSIKRVNPNPNLTQELQQTSESDRWLIYSDTGIWHEKLDALAEKISLNPNDNKLKSEWQNLLNSVGLNDVATEPLTSTN
ncbi:MAG: DUF928 domain-containing protein [Okeania sp. SIO2C9]|uniref:DUF928 domain-containing protein n=1 Tax=Okeania sp. SIO2C9 TaxID=2607791 RepID=UPI0013BECB57|nr:DUF928 domain-containing protein [Okeania sp. SIO2C9]NEQ75398.1 DUF928 domain-containing protein [Okeania sp. SIO2C9]